MKIRGKEYMEVKDRVMVFRKNNPEWAIITQIIENNEATGSIIFKVTIEDENGRIRGTGHAHEFKDDKTSMVNKTSHLENCETSAIGRALASLGIGVESSYATYDEVMIAMDKQDRMEDNKPSSDDVREERKSVKEGAIKQSNSKNAPEGLKEALLVKWPGKRRKEFVNKTLGAIMKKDAGFLFESLKNNGDVIKEQSAELFSALEIVLWDYEDKNDMNFPDAK